MSDRTRIGDLFQQPPTRDLEEVQKVETAADHAQAERDIAEFIETDSAKSVVSALTERVAEAPAGRPRLLYLHATFGSGKSHLLKLVGLATGQVPGCEDLADRLAGRFLSFKKLRDAFQASDSDAWVPVFLNLLDRDPAADPPLPYLVYLALSRRLGYPTDPAWLTEWAWRADLEAGLWPAVEEAEQDGRSFLDALAERAPLRGWLQSAVPDLPGAGEVRLGSQSAVASSIREAEETVDPARFDGSRLANRLESAREILSGRKQGEVQFLLGLDEVALFVGDSERRFKEFQATVDALQRVEQPLVVATGQWSLASMAEDFYDQVPEAWMREDEVQLRAADAEEIVRKRWLRKTEDGRRAIERVLGELPQPVLERGEDRSPPADVAATYPFLPGDLRHFREVTEEILTAGADTDREFIQGRALLVYVRGLFTELGWAEEPLGRLVSWDLLFDLLATQGGYLPGWVGDLLHMVQDSVRGEVDTAVRVVKTLYLLDHVPSVPATVETVTHRLITEVGEDSQEVEERVRAAIDELEEKHLVYPDETAEADTVYRLLSREEVTVSQKIQQQRVSQAQIRVRLEQWLQEHDYCASEDLRREIDLNGERQVPLRTRYSVLSLGTGSSASAFDAVTLRFLVHHENVDDAVDRWRSRHEDRGREGEDVLAVIQLPEAFYADLDRAIAMTQVLEREPRRVKDLEAKARRQQNELHRRFQDLLEHAALYRPGRADPVGEFGADFAQLVADRVLAGKFPHRKVLQRSLRPIDAADDLTGFFAGDVAWSLTPEDAELLGVDTAARELESDGWIEGFLGKWGESEFVEGDKDLLPRIQGPAGDYLGTPLETLQALVLVAAAARRITVRRQGEAVLDPPSLAASVRTKSALEGLVFRSAPPEEEQRSKEVEELYETLAGEPVEDLSPTELLEKVGRWARKGLGRVREVDRELRRRTTAEARLTALEEALAPAEAGHELREADLAAKAVQEEAERFALARRYFGGDLEDLWNELEETAGTLRDCYPASRVNRQVSRSFAVPDLPSPDAVRDLLRQARETRASRLESVYSGLFGAEPSEKSLKSLQGRLWEDLTAQADQLRQEIKANKERLGEALELSQIQGLLDEAADGASQPDTERLESEAIELEARRLGRARMLTDDRDGASLWDALHEAVETLQDEHPDSLLQMQVQDVLSRPELPDPEVVKRLVRQVEETPDRPVEKGDSKQFPEELRQWFDELEDGAMVAVLKVSS